MHLPLLTHESCVGVLLYILQMHIGIEVCYKSSFLYDVSDENWKLYLFLYIVRLSIHIKVTFHSEFESLKIISFASSSINVTILWRLEWIYEDSSITEAILSTFSWPIQNNKNVMDQNEVKQTVYWKSSKKIYFPQVLFILLLSVVFGEIFFSIISFDFSIILEAIKEPLLNNVMLRMWRFLKTCKAFLISSKLL